MTELVPRSVRIHHDSSGRRTWLSCSCNPETTVSATDSPEDGGASRLGGDFCPHLVWLLDQVLGQTLYHHNRDEPLVMRSTGYARELGDPFDSIRHHSLEILAAGLHCPLVIDPSRRDGVDRTRALETRELLSSVHHAEPDQFRPDIFGVGHGVPAAMEEEGDQGDEDQEEEREEEYHGDLDLYIARMLLDNGHLFNYFVSRSKPSDPINNPFRKLSQRVDLVMHRLDQVTSTATRGQRSGKSNDPDPDPDPVTPSVVAWAAHHVAGCVRLIRSAVFSRHRPLTAPQALSAASTLVHILEAVATRDRDTRLPTPRAPRAERNLYLRMIGDRDDDFVLDVLGLIPQAASQFIHDLERLLDSYITVQGAPTAYVSRFRALLARLRTSGTGAGLKRRGPREEGTGAERGPKRMK
ncbi:hypothetical protein GMORB2_5673 [Geosmithia morbida]|uniref:SWIM-type domain-containing protein n=1 Tax=Geosmithia morbida TaxID=1094350 RepID=A0A9P4YWR7_9HYPO|nr:uncharacterized protein GMORB2_5673 [Geosmithia morbida]KAF4123957.1 hypothetical protein GMORB2_5673 [Geosmithia morbida]